MKFAGCEYDLESHSSMTTIIQIDSIRYVKQYEQYIFNIIVGFHHH